MPDINYYEIYKNSKDSFFIRFKIVKSAKKIGIKPTARKYNTTIRTVKKWLNRFNAEGKNGLKDKSKKPKQSPYKIKPYWEFKILEICRKLKENNKRIVPTYIKNSNDIPYSIPTVIKVIRNNGYFKKRKVKRERQKDLREYKKKYKPFEKIQIDVKYLDDIPEMYKEFVMHKLPKYQFTARCIRTGALFVCYGQEKSLLNATIFLILLLIHLKKYKVNLKNTRFQTDNGTEFTNNGENMKESIFTIILEKVEKLTHRLIPPGAKTYQSDVEISHRIIEDEFYSQELIASYDDFFKKAEQYTERFNLYRFNEYKNGSPRQLLNELNPKINSKVLKFKPVLLDNYIDFYKKYMMKLKVA